VLRETGEIQETYWLMETLLENMEAALKHGWVGSSSALAGEEKK